MNKNIFYCYSVHLKDFLKSQGMNYIDKAINPNSKSLYFMFEKSKKLDLLIEKWNKTKLI
jgi:hypothetical protein